MKQAKEPLDIPIRRAVIAWQPASLPRSTHSAAAGDVAIVELYDPMEGRFAMTHGAGWYWWSDESIDYLLGRLAWLKRLMVRDFGMSARRIEEAFAVIPEYRFHQADRGRAQQPRRGR